MGLSVVEYIRKPQLVNVIEVTRENMEELNTFFKLGQLQEKEDGTPFIVIPTRKSGSSFKVFPGFFVVDMGRHTRCFSRRLFFDQYEPA